MMAAVREPKLAQVSGAHDRDPGDRVGPGHQRGVQGVRHLRQQLAPDEDREHEHVESDQKR